MVTDPDDARSTCIHCREPIRPGAQRCPSCLSWQSRWAADSRHPGLEIALVGGLVIAMVLLVVAWANLSAPGGAGNPARDEATSLQIVESKIEVVGRGPRRHALVVGTIDNRSNVALRDIYFYVELRDASGDTIDAFHSRLATMVVPAGSKTTFKLADGEPLRDPDEYASCSVQVRHASVAP